MPREGNAALPEDRERLIHMRDAASDALFFATTRTRADLETDRMFARALVHAIQEIGEAAARVSKSGRDRAPEIPWGSIVQMRHIIVHAYFNINYDFVWRVVENDLKPLLQMIHRALEKWPETPQT